jgi:DNA-binding transcriptional LysR family regulator
MTKVTRRLGQISDIDLRLLKIFCSVVENGGISAAEISLGISRSTISTHLREIETRLNVVLCQRGRSGFRLTPPGQEIYRYTVEFLSELERFRQRLNGVDDTVSGKLSIGMVDNLIWENNPALLATFADFARQGSAVDLSVRLLSPDEVERGLMEQKLDIGILTALHTLPSLSYVELYQEANYLYCGPGHELYALPDSQITEERLKRASYVNKGYVVTEFMEETERRMNVKATAYDVESIAFLILSGEYIGFLPERYANVWIERGQMRALLAERYSTQFDVMAATAKGAHPSQPLRVFLDILRKHCPHHAGHSGLVGKGAQFPS